ncbi:MAG: 50S ribosomal protein L4, partial [Muribaculaceae bacterium]|nr:50S ribosomal protein L4 [Muribaculaceae bacterium]
PRAYRFKLNKKIKQLARKSALSLKARDGEILVVENFTIDAPKTKDFINIVKNLKVDGKKVLVVLPSQDKNVYLSSRNVPGAVVATVADINTYTLLNNKAILLAEGSLEAINKL